MKIVYFGSDVFLSCFQYLMEHHEIMALYTYHNSEDYFQELAITKTAKEHGIPIFYEEISEDMIEAYQKSGCALFVIAEYNKLIRLPLQQVDFRGLNIHNSLLPQGRSYYPIETAMALGVSFTGVTIHKLTSTLDGGDVLAQSTITIEDDIDSIDVYLENAKMAKSMLVHIMNDFEQSWRSAMPQKGRLPHWKRPDESLLTLMHDQTVEDALDMFRRFNQLVQVELNGVWYYVTSIMKGSAAIPSQVCHLQQDLYLYQLTDGHARITVREMTR